MNLSHRKKIIIYILPVMVLTVVLGLVGLRMWIWRGGAEMYAGKVVQMDEKGFILENKEGKEIRIIIGPETKIIKGRKDIPRISLVGEEVFAIGVPKGPNEIEARIVRILKHK